MTEILKNYALVKHALLWVLIRDLFPDFPLSFISCGDWLVKLIKNPKLARIKNFMFTNRTICLPNRLN